MGDCGYRLRKLAPTEPRRGRVLVAKFDNRRIVGPLRDPAVDVAIVEGFSDEMPTLTIQALAYMSADAIVNRYKNNPGPLL